MIFIAALLACGAATGHGQSALDGFDPNANSLIHAVVVQPDGKILIGGAFTTLAPKGGPTVTRNHIARLNPDGTLDTAFDPNASHAVFTIALQADGKILAGGNFFDIGGEFRISFARLDATTGLADSFNPNVGAILVHSIAVQADGKILVGGALTSSGGEKRNGIARIDPVTGQTDSFDPNANSTVTSIVIQPDGKILAGGPFTEIGGQIRNGLARLNPTTGLADSFNPNARHTDTSGSVEAIAVQADGKILAGGNFTSIGGQARHNIARLDPATGLADSFDPHASSLVETIALQTDGKILVGGYFHGANSIGGQTRNYLARLDPVSGLADSLDPNAEDMVESIAVQADGKILVVGGFTAVAPNGGATVTRNRIARLEIDGRLDQTLDINTGGVMSTAVQPDGKILIGGVFTTVLGVPRNYMARLNRDGTLDTAFDPDMDDSVWSIVVQPDGKILVGGLFTSIGGETRHHIGRLDATTGAPDSFDPNANELVQSIVVQTDGKILAGGNFTSIGGQTRNRIARLDPATGLADSFDPDASSLIHSIAVQADGQILAGGAFSSIGGQARNYLARLDAGTGLADSFDPDADDSISSIVVQPDGKILAGGFFTGIGGQTRRYLARLEATTGLADSFDPNASFLVHSIALQADGQILAGGFFTSIGGEMRNHMARLDATTGLADLFDPSANTTVYSIALEADGKVLVGGFYNTIGGETRQFARLSNDTAALQNLDVTQTTVTWSRDGASPALTRVTFESSTDNVKYAPLGHGIPQSGSRNWTLTGLSLPTEQNIYIRARGYYRGGYQNGSESITESVRKAFVRQPATQAVNLSTRMRVQTGDNAGIGGFIITGTVPKYVLLRGIGPSLTQFGVPDALADPVLELYSGITVIGSNNDWRDTDQAEIEATGIPPTNDFEAAIVAVLSPGSYTAVLRGNNDGTGVALVEVYDLNQGVDSKLANISTRALVGTDDDIVIAGFILGNQNGNAGIVVRGLGPSLLTVPDPLANPTLELRNSDGTLLAFNNDWQDDPAQAADVRAVGLAPASNLEAGIVAALPPGPYTALLAGLNNGTGIGVVEVYDLGPP